MQLNNLNLHNFSLILFCIIRSEVLKLLILIFTTLVALGVIDSRDDRVANLLQVFHLLLKGVLIGVLVRVEPVLGLSNGLLDRILVVLLKLVGELILVLNGVAHREDVVLEGVLGVDTLLDSLVLVGELLGVGDHLLDLLGGEAALIISDGDGL